MRTSATGTVVSFFLVLLGGAVAVEPLSARASDPSQRKPLPPPEVLKELPPDGGPEYNRLVFEKSPYLLQHAANPVDWYSWGDEAFEKARRLDMPIFLSVGYSTCHWCHVMEHESFEDEEVAELMNEYFVSVKVDREERPDVDKVYMEACQAMTGRGGWPLTVLLTPEGKPFFAGTYFPKTSRFGRTGMLDLVPRLGQGWQDDRERLLATSQQITARLNSRGGGVAGSELDADVLEDGFRRLQRSFDSTHSGFGGAPKFPVPHRLTFLLRSWRRSGDPKALAMVEQTLQSMRRGGIHDHVGFGFHRYSTDSRWLVPHFEKMLYDQAMLTIAYVEAYQATDNEDYARTVREVLTYVLRDMTGPQGGFYSAEDADSEGVEGKFYVWSADEVRAVLGEDADLYIKAYNIRPGGNFRNPHTPPSSNIPHLTEGWTELASRLGIPEGELHDRLEQSRQKLFAARERRVHPLKDDKILTDWNGLMIAAMAKAARALNEPEYAAAAQRASDFVWERLRDSRGRLLKRYREGEAALAAHVEDYAFIVWGLLELYEANFKVKNLRRAIELNDQLLARFWDDQAGGFFFTADDGESLIVRWKDVYDGAIPSGNSTAMMNLLRIGRITGDARFEEKAEELGRAFAGQVRRNPTAHTQLLSALEFGIGPSFEVVIVGNEGDDDTAAMAAALREVFVPNKVVLFRPGHEDSPAITEIAAFTKNQRPRDGKTTAYVCRNHRCKEPTTDIAAMLGFLTQKSEE